MTEIIPQDSLPTQKSLLAKFSFKRTKLQTDLLAGSVAGLAVVLTGHPLDTIKVRIQMLGTGFLETVKSLVKSEGIINLYKGVASPLYSSPFITAISFANYEFANRMQGLKHGDKRPIPNALLSGAWAGFTFGFIVTPIDLLKTKLQMEGVGENSKSTKLSTLTRQIIKQNGILGLYKGLHITLLRDVPGVALQFAIFEAAKENMNKLVGESGLSSFLAGAVANFGGWMVAYPQDMVKTKIQYSSRPMGIIECTKHIYQTAGFKGFWKGINPCLLRALVTGATRYLMYDKCQEFLRIEEDY